MNSPFDEARYRGLLEGLEASEIPLSALERTVRMDSEFFRPKHLLVAGKLAVRDTQSVTNITAISDGNHFAISEEFCEEGIPYYRGQDVVGHFFIEQSTPVFITEKAYLEPFMTRSHLQRGDVLLSIVGSIGEASLVTDNKPATCSCKLAILRPQGIAPEYLSIFLRSEYGRNQIERFTRGAVQMGLLLEDMDQIRVARLAPDFEAVIVEVVKDAQQSLDHAIATIAKAEQTLLRALGLENWQPPEPLTYTRPSRDAFAAGRLDAEHFQEKYYAARSALSAAGALEFLPIEDLLVSITNGQTPLRHDLSVGEVPFLCAEHVSDYEIDFNGEKRILETHHRNELARTALKNGDVLLTIKGRVGNAAIAENVPGMININQDVALLRFNDRLPIWYIVAFINNQFGKLQTEQMCTGAINPFLGLFSIKQFVVPVFEDSLMAEIAEETRSQVQAARKARRRAAELLEAAKSAVEIAIEDSEAAALAWLEPVNNP